MTNSRLSNPVFLTILHLSFLLTVAITAYGQEVRVDNAATYVGSGRYDWTVFLVADRSVLDSIKYVEYTLNPSFPNPVQRIKDRDTDFALTANGWGEFDILVKVVFKDGRSTYLKHRLRLEERSREDIETVPALFRAQSAITHGEITTENTARYVGRNEWDWTVFIVSDDKTLSEVECVEYTLHPTFPNPVHEVCNKGSTSGRGFFLNASGWGTFSIGVKVIFRDGDVRYLEHQLSFSDQK